MTCESSENNKLWTGCLCGLVLLNAALFWCSSRLVVVAKSLYQHVLPGEALTSACRLALLTPEWLLVLTGLITATFLPAALGRLPDRRVIGLVFAMLLVDVAAMLFMARGFLSPFAQVTWIVQ